MSDIKMFIFVIRQEFATNLPNKRVCSLHSSVMSGDWLFMSSLTKDGYKSNVKL